MASNPFNLALGAPVWRYGRNDTPDKLSVASATTRSWVLSDGAKVPKNHAAPVYEVNPGFGCMLRYCLTRESADALLLEHSRWAMSHRISHCTDPAALRAVASALGMPTGVVE